MNINVHKFHGAYYVIDGYSKGLFKIVNSKDLTDYKEFFRDGRSTIRDQASQYLNSIGLHVVGIVEYSKTYCLMIVNEDLKYVS